MPEVIGRLKLDGANGHLSAASPTSAGTSRLTQCCKLIEPEGRTDTSNAARLGARYGEVIRWVGPWDRWVIWDGQRWKIDRSLAIDLKAKDIAADLFAEIATLLRESNK